MGSYLRLGERALLQNLSNHLIVDVGAELVIEINLRCSEETSLGTVSGKNC